jgi:hypothetical protein
VVPEKRRRKKIQEKKRLSSNQITASEKNCHKMLGKYVESISHSVTEQARKKV